MKFCYTGRMSFCQSNILSKPFFTGFVFHYILFVIGRIQDGNIFLLNILRMLFDYIVMFMCKFHALLKLDNLFIHFYYYYCSVVKYDFMKYCGRYIYMRKIKKIQAYRIFSLKLNLRKSLYKGSTLLVRFKKMHGLLNVQINIF